MAQNDREITRLFQDASKHTVESVRAGGHLLDFANMPTPVKHYPDLEPILLPVDLPERDAPAARCSRAAWTSRLRRRGSWSWPVSCSSRRG